MAGAARNASDLNYARVICCDTGRHQIRMPLGIVSLVVVIPIDTQHTGRRRILQIWQVDQSAIIETLQ